MMEKHPGLAREAGKDTSTPMTLAMLFGSIHMVRVILEHDSSLGYETSGLGVPLLESAAYRGQVDAARELLKYCPDAPYRRADGWTCLHSAVWYDQAEFVEFIVKKPQLRNVINMQDSKGKTALHYAVQKCNPKIVVALLSHKDINATVIDNNAGTAAWELLGIKSHAKTLNWVLIYTRPYESHYLAYVSKSIVTIAQIHTHTYIPVFTLCSEFFDNNYPI